ncbi:hypothetical protein Poli38472_008547 [Pythium oligandrum]|uniref:Uncharacterized protein n=1 Tax=Pythium oligandrum TaxID=41045 RepID=A0A8K1C3N3_PYTOL|nr:hypothetical protein Poli38472_008547 [Pythium oligandrum]|eukprot:TMW55899.1 hypothetical protein Poli38472_008547 [Pythium oligandrum]
MSETARDDEQDDYDAAYADDHEDPDDDGDENEEDDAELAEMFAKVQTIQQNEGIRPKSSRSETADSPLQVKIPPRTTSGSGITPHSSRSSPVSSAASSNGSTRSPDGITTISRKSLTTNKNRAAVDVLLGVKMPSLFQDKLVETAKRNSQTLEQMKQKVVAAPPAKIAVRSDMKSGQVKDSFLHVHAFKQRVETLAAPKRADSGRKFATDDEEKHCRFQPKKKKGGSANTRDDFDDDDSGGGDRTHEFIARMEAAERNRQKKLELTRGEKDYLANLSKKYCPNCQVPQSYSEFRDKKKRCQMCGAEFRLPHAWGDIGHEFINRISDDAKLREERKEQIRAHVVTLEATHGRVPKSSTQQYYEKQLRQRQDPKSFLDRNYYTTSATASTSASNSKTRLAQAQLQMQIQAQRAKLLTSAQPPII